MKYLARCEPHHHSEIPGYKQILDIAEGQDPLYAALLWVWDQGGIDGASSECHPPTQQEWALIMARGCNGAYTVLSLPYTTPPAPVTDDELEGLRFSFRYHPGPDDAQTNVWFGAGDVTGTDMFDKYNCSWVNVEPFVPDPKRLQELHDLTYDELIELILKLEAEVR